jgi:hypothetical protein
MAVRKFPVGIDKKKYANRSIDELQRMLRDRTVSLNKESVGTIKMPDGRIINKGPARRTGVPADTRSRSARGALPPGQVVKKTTPAQSDRRTPTPVTPAAPLNPRMAPKVPVKGGSTVNLRRQPALQTSKNPLKKTDWNRNAILRRLRKRYKLNAT